MQFKWELDNALNGKPYSDDRITDIALMQKMGWTKAELDATPATVVYAILFQDNETNKARAVAEKRAEQKRR